MVRNYKRLTNRGDWSEESMKKAVDAVIEGRMGYLVASRTFSVPQTTLERKVKTARDNLESNSSTSTNKLKVPLGPKEQVFSEAEEKELSDYIMEMESRLYGLTVKDLKSLAYSLAKKNNKVHPFNTEKEEAGKDWVLGFLKRHPELSIRKPESTSAARASGFNKEVVDAFYTFLGNVYDEHQLTPDRIYNCDETGISVVPKTKSKIIAKKGRKQVGSITSAERGTTITVEICFSASGLYMPPMMIFPRKRMDPQLMLNGAPGAWGVCSDSGWMTTELFLQWFKEFVRFSGATVDRKVLLLLDGHSTHTQNIDLINEARSNGVIILCFPPHTTHRLQVADVAFMRPLSTYYDQQITAWLRSHPGMVVTVRQVGEIFGKAFVQASTMSTAVNGFRKCGIWPYDPTVFSESDFAPSLTTDIPQVQRPVTQTQTDREGASSTSNIAREDAVSPSLISPEPEFSSHSGTNVLNMATLTEIPAVLQRDASQSVPICIPASSIPAATSDAMLSVLPHTEPRIEPIFMPTSNLTADAATSEVTEVSDLLCVESSSKPDYMPASDILSNTFGKATPIENLSDLSSVQPATQSVSMLSSKSPTNTPYTCISNATLSTLPRDELQAELVGFPASKVPVDFTNMSKSITTPSETQLVMVRNPASPTATVTSATVTIPATKPKTLPESVIFNTPTSTNERSTLANTQPQPGCSTWSDNLDIVRRPTTPKDSIFSLASPEQIIPFPTTQKTVRSTRKRGKTAIITASPYKNELEEKIKKKKEDDNKKEERKRSKISKKQNNVKSNKKAKGKQKQKKSVKRKSSPENSDSEVENTPCLFCSGLYLDSNEGWAACRACGKWAHCGCAGIDDEDEEATFTLGEKERPTRVAWRAACGAGVAELLGTALLVLGCCLPRPANRALAAGIVVASLVQCFDHVSGAMLNPAMSLAGAMLGRVSWRRAALYSLAQVAGGTLGALLLSCITGVEYCSACVTLLGTELGAGVSAAQGVAVEAVLTGCLALANAAAWDRRAPSGDSWPLRLGTTVAALSLVGGELTGASMNPARSFGPALWAQNFTHHWVYWAGPLLGAAGGSLLYNVLWALPRTPQPSSTSAPGTAPLVAVACS